MAFIQHISLFKGFEITWAAVQKFVCSISKLTVHWMKYKYLNWIQNPTHILKIDFKHSGSSIGVVLDRLVARFSCSSANVLETRRCFSFQISNISIICNFLELFHFFQTIQRNTSRCKGCKWSKICSDTTINSSFLLTSGISASKESNSD